MFGSPWLAFADGLRVVMILGGLALVCVLANRAAQAFSWAERGLLGSFAMTIGVAVGDQVERLGQQTFSWRVWPSLIVVLIGLWSACRYDPLGIRDPDPRSDS